MGVIYGNIQPMPAHKISLTVRVLCAVQSSPVPLKAHQVARKLNHPCNSVRVLLGRLLDRGDIVQVHEAHGIFYAAPSEPEVSIWEISMRWRRS